MRTEDGVKFRYEWQEERENEGAYSYNDTHLDRGLRVYEKPGISSYILELHNRRTRTKLRPVLVPNEQPIFFFLRLDRIQILFRPVDSEKEPTCQKGRV